MRPGPAEANPSPDACGLACSGATGGRLAAPRLTTAIPRRVRVGLWRRRELSTRGPRFQSPSQPAAAPSPLLWAAALPSGRPIATRPVRQPPRRRPARSRLAAARPFCSSQPAPG
ncbi:hypothetical protein BDA96_01G323000 [Sorghum bicolor]|uniref:Uncharacterized protein n=1 Tax=Sorghum bicolor TaxID=4558 RepID=A0A921S2N1_SORBI|nr:hypothetical protein BDA96_01G323000 [Sorghum bicolor]